MTILCNLQNINLAFGEKIIFQDAKFSISMGDKIGLIGLNGHGKSTLFNILSGDVTPDISNPPFIFDKHNEHWSLFYVPQELEVDKFQDLKIEEFYLSLDLMKQNQYTHICKHRSAAFYKIGDEPDSDKENSEYQRQFSEWDEKLNEFKAQNNWDKFSK